MNKTEAKQYAQDEIMNALATVLISYQHQNSHHTAAEQQQVEAEIMKQANRVAKLFGYREAWHN